MKRKITGFVIALFLLTFVVEFPIIQTWAIDTRTDSTTINATDGQKQLSPGVQNIVKRAYQMTEIQWTPQKDVCGWNNELTYRAGVTYTGLPYGQPVYASYVPWSTSLQGFIDAVNDTNSKMYTAVSTYEATAPYYSTDCSAFVSWAWQLPSRQTTSTMANFATRIDSSIQNLQVGDCLCAAGSHVVLVTDIVYDASGNIIGVEISEATVNAATHYCCQKTWYGEGGPYSLQTIQSKYLNKGYVILRSKTRDNVTYTHLCCVPLEGDDCALCGLTGYDVKSVSAVVILAQDTPLHSEPDTASSATGNVTAGSTLTVSAYAICDDSVWYRTGDGSWLNGACVRTAEYRASAAVSGESYPSGNLAYRAVFPIEGTVTSINPIISICATIENSEGVVQKKEFTSSGIYSYILRSSAIDNSMEFNKLEKGSYTFVMKITEKAYCPAAGDSEDLVTTVRSSFTVGQDAEITRSCGGRGIDVSHHQTVDWDVVAPQIDFAILRCGFGDDMTNQDDRQWIYNADACTRLGIPFGVYIYSYALTDDQALSEAQHVMRLLQGYQPQLPVYLDLEDGPTVGTLSNAEILRHTQIFCNAIAEAGYTPGVYASYSWWTSRLTSSAYDSYSRWIAIWGTDNPGYSKSYDIWQYTDSGSINGISGPVDMDYWYGDALPDTCDHIFSFTSVPASCIEDGTNTYTCTVCGYSYHETIAALGHNYSERVVQPGCEEQGYTVHSCTRCGEQYKDSYVDALGHDYLTEVVQPTCEGQGYTTHVCRRCEAQYIDSYTEALGHDYVAGHCSRCDGVDPSRKSGDLNDDGKVTSADAVLLSRYLADIITLDEVQLTASDLNGDGKVTSADAVILARFLAGIIETLP